MVFLLNHMALKTANEAVVESMGGILDRHASPGRHLSQDRYAQEAFIHWNGPPVHAASALLSRALDRHFGKDSKAGKQKPWHFLKEERTRTLYGTASSRPHRQYKV